MQCEKQCACGPACGRAESSGDRVAPWARVRRPRCGSASPGARGQAMQVQRHALAQLVARRAACLEQRT
eukprot:13152719-Alexandrium_andersonii.AAC.1